MSIIIEVGAFNPASPFQIMTSRAAGRITSAISPGHEGILVLVGVCVNRIGKVHS
jgi:hypothetical protein